MPMDRRHKRIIVEGMDGSGKSTLISQLANEFPRLEIVLRPEGKKLREWWYEELNRSEDSPVPLHDRFFYSELVYGPIVRHTLAVDQAVVNQVIDYLHKNAMLIYVRPLRAVIQSKVLLAPQMAGVIDHFDSLLETYDAIMTGERTYYGRRFHHYDWHDFGACVDAVDRYLGT